MLQCCSLSHVINQLPSLCVSPVEGCQQLVMGSGEGERLVQGHLVRGELAEADLGPEVDQELLKPPPGGEISSIPYCSLKLQFFLSFHQIYIVVRLLRGL